jgi:hypothetical protein
MFKTDDSLNHLANFVEKLFSKTLPDALESAKNTFFCDVTKVKFFFLKCLTLSKKNQKSSFNGGQN